MALKPIRISGHALFEMTRRGIRRADVVRMVRQPGQVVPGEKGRHVYQGLIGKARRLLLRVVVASGPRAFAVVTAYKTSKVAKYWRSP
jgi:hypothetical protein